MDLIVPLAGISAVDVQAEGPTATWLGWVTIAKDHRQLGKTSENQWLRWPWLYHLHWPPPALQLEAQSRLRNFLCQDGMNQNSPRFQLAKNQLTNLKQKIRVQTVLGSSLQKQSALRWISWQKAIEFRWFLLHQHLRPDVFNVWSTIVALQGRF